ncbi:MAG: YceI family protein [Flavobacteriia bacterium]|nr:YceI family protein [Flavobacteriia bacterium]OIP47164.1 MAG: polyisoprenoid-binding protein [Flavobacteriaceae bacterium CG2_30_31_66]PIV97682.1 MAG: polyisoprenoid-binding protein [Flavobacteriaceae bacterium CG17_big_fil_post_rev_8_21_14_2_50_31_13]PIX13358.1 MAG: polyisoprenoid-binding protein [Flavobacteriaceae bacterium CG_4_8_14_3_um_filter_31_8]PIY13811.1 MAG: polyisoprenoid-binding protein [Flavobacteriaceae bacterium CG_4_10_14_3_um_filter_31_253]PIZ10713.1 MAG: polyisoprenoid-bin
MKKSIVIVVILAAVFTAFKSAEKESVVLNEEVKTNLNFVADNVDVTASVLNWKGSKPLGTHSGTVTLKSGNLELKNGALKGGVFVVDLTSIKNLDMAGTDGAEKIEGHLKSADFFDVEKYPTATFTITKVKKEGTKLAVTGNLQIKDVTKSITIPAMIATENGVTVFKSEVFNINRTDFNVRYGSKSFFDNLKDKFIDDMMEMSFVVKTKA